MPSHLIRDPWRAPHLPPVSDTPITDLAQQLQRCDFTIDCWPRWDEIGRNQAIRLFPDHREWFDEIKRRIGQRGWDPDQLRVITADAPSAARLASWIRKAQYSVTTLWRRGERVRSLDSIFQDGELVAPAGTEFKILNARSLDAEDHGGIVTWTTPVRSEHRELELAASANVAALRLQPLTGGDPIVVMAEQPSSGDPWREQCFALRKALAGCRHDADTYADAITRIDTLQQRVIRLRSATCITPELINGRRFEGVAAHPDLGSQYGGGIASTVLAVAAASKELLLVRQRALD